MLRTKPRLRRGFDVGGCRWEWRCTDATAFALGWGQTPEAAYEAWLRVFAAWRRRQTG